MLEGNMILTCCLQTQTVYLVYEIVAEDVYQDFIKIGIYLILVIIHEIQSF